MGKCKVVHAFIVHVHVLLHVLQLLHMYNTCTYYFTIINSLFPAHSDVMSNEAMFLELHLAVCDGQELIMLKCSPAVPFSGHVGGRHLTLTVLGMYV